MTSFGSNLNQELGAKRATTTIYHLISLREVPGCSYTTRYNLSFIRYIIKLSKLYSKAQSISS